MEEDPIPYQITVDQYVDRIHARSQLVIAVQAFLKAWDASTENGTQSPTQRSMRLAATVDAMREVARRAAA